MTLRHQHWLDGAQRWAGVLPRVTRPARWNDIAERVRAAFRERHDVILRQPPFAAVIAIRAAIIEGGLKRVPLRCCHVVYGSAHQSRASAKATRGHRPWIVLAPFSIGIRMRGFPLAVGLVYAVWMRLAIRASVGLVMLSMLNVVGSCARAKGRLVLCVVGLQVRAHPLFVLGACFWALLPSLGQDGIAVLGGIAVAARATFIRIVLSPLRLSLPNAIGVLVTVPALGLLGSGGTRHWGEF